ncbi:MAG TPA: hypothetical protein VLH10_10485 [Yinghuangia sp.]|uniref:hypothetical protein n=1 Tax=Yinghuangia sp. YIM S10712 TaxID=3436930 RepID=UPI002CC0E8EC|nr:hypothetical protein [Yinghuangia sp.]
MDRPAWRRVWNRRPGDPPKRVFWTLLALTAAGTLWLRSIPLGDFFAQLVALWVWFGLAVAWLALLVSGLVRREGRARLRTARTRVRWLVAPVLVVVLIAALYFQVSLRARFALSEAALRKIAVATAEGRAVELGQAGLYRVTEAEAVPDGVLLTLDGADGFLTTGGGFGYFPNGVPPMANRDVRFTHVWGAWYSWWEAF